ncbi:hypothetical protein VTK26DRAFT_5102 [Humicola hyalothermophila]
MASTKQKLEALLEELSKINKLPRLSAAVDDLDKIISLLSTAREQVAETLDPHTASLTMTKLQNPIKAAFDKVNDDLKAASSAHKKVGKALDKHFPLKPLPADTDNMGDHLPLINRAIAMHLLREGQFSVTSTFINEVEKKAPPIPPPAESDEIMSDAEGNNRERDAHGLTEEDYGLLSLHSQELQERFAEMYGILQEIKAQNLVPAIRWARANSVELEARGSNLEFELSKLQYVWLFQGSAVNGLPDDERNGPAGALAYAREHFGRFQGRHLREIQQLASALVYASNLSESPYRQGFATGVAFTDVAASFTREFCSLLGLSAESPLYLAVTAGALALPQLMKYLLATRATGTEWTTAQELPFETPLPESMLYHSIFVCPVSKEQTTDENPPMVIPCGHMLARDTLQKLCKGNRFKCPYCPTEGQFKDARRVIL